MKHEDCMTRLRVARQYGVDDWFLPALKDVMARDEPLTVDEVNQLGLDFAVKGIALREAIRGPALIPRQVFNLTRRCVHDLGSLTASRMPPNSLIADNLIRRRLEGNLGASA